MKPLFFNALTGTALFCSALTIANVAQADDMARYQLQPTPNGVVRLDTHTGELAYCHEAAGALDCASALPDADVIKRIDALEDRIASLERQGSKDGLPSDEELEKGFSIMEKFMRRFKGLADELNNQERNRSDDTLPQKT